MSVVRFFQPENRLAKAIAAPGGKRVSEAVADAERGVSELSGACLASVDESLARIYAAGARPLDHATLTLLYGDMRQVAGTAQAAGLGELGAAAHAICGLLDAALQGRSITQDHLQVCANVLKTLRQAQSVPPAERAAMAEGLGAMVHKLSTR